MKKAEIEGLLNGAGHRSFVNFFKCFETAWKNDARLTNDDLLRCDPQLYEECRGDEPTENSLNTKRSKTRMIFKNNKQLTALRICMNADRVDKKTRKKAERLYERYRSGAKAKK